MLVLHCNVLELSYTTNTEKFEKEKKPLKRITKIKTKKYCVASQIFQNVGHLFSYSTSKVKAFRIIVKHNLHRGAGWKVMPQNLNRFAYIANSGS